jgi:two-component system response regulator
MQMKTPWPTDILLVESQPDHADAARRAFAHAGLLNRLHVVTSHWAALDLLFQRGEFQNAPRPDLIILNPAISGRTGWVLFAEIKADPSLKQIPVAILSASRLEAEMLNRGPLNAHFIEKPVQWDYFISAMLTTQVSLDYRGADAGRPEKAGR